MTQEFKLEDTEVVLDSEILYAGKEKPDEHNRNVRKIIGLPTTKQLIYYTNLRDPKSAKNVKEYRILESYNISFLWFLLEIVLEDDSSRKIHSSFLAEMQKPSFIADLDKQMS